MSVYLYLLHVDYFCFIIQVQQGSPAFCLFVKHWEPVGLATESSMAWYDLVLVIKTDSYLSWMRWFMKAHQKPLDSTFSLPCRFLPVPQNRLSLNISSDILTSHGFTIQSCRGRSGTLPLNRKCRNHPPVFLVSNSRASFPGSGLLHLKSSQLPSASRLPMVKPWTSPTAKPWDPSKIAGPWALSDPQSPPTAHILVPKDFLQGDSMKYQQQTMTDSVRSWVNPLAGIIGLHTLSLVNAGESWILFLSDTDGSQVPTEITTVWFQAQSTEVPLHGQLLTRPWLETAPNVEPWTYGVPKNIRRVIQIQSSGENIKAQMRHVAYKVNTDVKPVAYKLDHWVPLIVNEIKLWTHSIPNANRYQ